MDGREDVYRLARWWAFRYRWAVDAYGHIDIDDLIQAAVIGIMEAAESYDDSKGTWFSWSSYFVRREIRALLGPRGRPLPPFVRSLNECVGDDEETELIELIPDESAPDPQEVSEYNDLQAGVRAAVQRMKNDREREVVQRNRLNGEPLRTISDDLGVSIARLNSIWNRARKHLSNDRKLRELADLDDSTSFISRSSVRTFNTTNTSDVERLVMWREDQRERILGKAAP